MDDWNSGDGKLTLCDALDRILTKGVVANGDLVISVAGVDLLYIGLRGLLCAVDSMDNPPTSLMKGKRSIEEASVGCEPSQTGAETEVK